MNAKKVKTAVTKILAFAKDQEWSKTKIGATVVTGLATAIVVLDAVLELQIIFN